MRVVGGLVVLLLAGNLFAADYYVATNGSDAAVGTIAAPFATIQHGVGQLTAGDTLFVRGGTYRETVAFPAGGTAGNPIVVKVYAGETAVVSGADVFFNAWTVHSNSIYKASISGQIRQLFINGKNTNEARWPNADPENLVNMPRGLLDDGSTTNILVDSDLPVGDFVGAIVHINPGSQYISYTRRVASYTPGVQFTVDTPLRPDTHYTPKKDNPYWLFGVYDALDAENEWFVNTNSNEIFLWAPGGVNPGTLKVEVKARDIAFDLSNRSYVEIDGFDIFAGGVRMEESSFCTVRNCSQKYVEHYREINEHAWNTFSNHSEENYFSGSNNSWINCEIYHSASHGIYDYDSVSNTVRNCHISHVNYMAHRAGCVWSRNTEHSLFERNTFELSGKYAFFFREAKWAKVRFNIMRYGGLLSGYDGGLSYGQNEGNGIEHAYNWVHFYGWAAREAWGSGIYWDDTSWGSLAHHNVVWDMYDGNFRLNNRETDADPAVQHHHRIYNNTCLADWADSNAPPVHPASDYPVGKDIYCIYAFTNQLEGTRFYNNIGVGTADKLQTQATGYEPYPATALNAVNYFEVPVTEQVVLAQEILDFRPVESPNIVDAGVDPGTFDTGVTNDYPVATGGGTDMGAYEYGSPEYWIPGHQLPQASVPIPYDGAADMPLDRELIYLIGYEGAQANIYFGTASNALSFLATQMAPTNVLSAGALVPGTTYFWRVDTVLADSSVVTGEVWNFSTVAPGPPPAVVFADDFEAYSAGSSPPSSTWATQVELGTGTIRVFDMGGDNVSRLLNTTTDDRTVFGAIDAFAEQGLLTISFDSHLDGTTPVLGQLALSAGVATCASGRNQVRKVDIAANATTNAWQHFDWIVNQSGSAVNYYVDGGSYSVAAGSADLWRDGTRVVDNGTSVPGDTEQTDTTLVDSFGWTVNKANTADWRIDNVAVRDGAYVYIATPFEQWALLYGVSSATNDPDNDGLSNLAEFGLGGDPTNGAPTGYFPMFGKSSGGLAYVYPHRQNAELTYWPETTTNLVFGIWTNSGYTVFPTIGNFAPGFDAVTNEIPTLGNQTFIRLRIAD